MIKKIELKNFQSHKESVIELTEGLNFFTGESCHGKSAVIRSLDAVINNNVSDSQVSNWIERTKNNKPKDNFEVTVTTDKGSCKRVKGKDNYYQLNDDKPLETPGQGNPPDAVQEFFNLSDLNIQTQKNNFFLLNESAGYSARYLNNIVNLDIIDKTLSAIDSKIRNIRQKVKFKKENQEELFEELKQYEYIDSLEKDIIQLEQLQENINTLTERKDKLENYINEYKIVTEKIDSIEAIKYKDTVDSLIELLDNVKALIERKNKLESYIQNYKEIKEKIDKIKKKCEIDIDKLIEMKDDIKIQIERKNKLENFINSYREIEKKMIRCRRNLRLKKKEYEELMPDICPLCGRSEKE